MARRYVTVTYRRPRVAFLCGRLFGRLIFDDRRRWVRRLFRAISDCLSGAKIA